MAGHVQRLYFRIHGRIFCDDSCGSSFQHYYGRKSSLVCLHSRDLSKERKLSGIWVFVFLERALIPFGLHHILYSPFYYDNVVVPGGLYAYWATKLPEIAASSASLKSLVPMARITSTGFSKKIFGCPEIALAFYSTAKKEKKKKNLGLLIPITLTAIFCGVTEPIEFTFLFVAPVSTFVVHALLGGNLIDYDVFGRNRMNSLRRSDRNGFFKLDTADGKSLETVSVPAGHRSCIYRIYFVVFKFLIEI